MPSRIPVARVGLARKAPASVADREARLAMNRFYASAAWRRVRRAFLDANPVCVDCLAEGVVTPSTIPHHVEERLANPGRALDPTNLVALCGPCHTRRHKRKRPRGAGESPGC